MDRGLEVEPLGVAEMEEAIRPPRRPRIVAVGDDEARDPQVVQDGHQPQHPCPAAPAPVDDHGPHPGSAAAARDGGHQPCRHRAEGRGHADLLEGQAEGLPGVPLVGVPLDAGPQSRGRRDARPVGEVAPHARGRGPDLGAQQPVAPRPLKAADAGLLRAGCRRQGDGVPIDADEPQRVGISRPMGIEQSGGAVPGGAEEAEGARTKREPQARGGPAERNVGGPGGPGSTTRGRAPGRRLHVRRIPPPGRCAPGASGGTGWQPSPAAGGPR